MNTPQAQKFNAGQSVRFNGQTNHINDKIFTNQVGTVEFHLFNSPTLVQILIKAPGQRKNRSIAFHQDSLEVA